MVLNWQITSMCVLLVLKLLPKLATSPSIAEDMGKNKLYFSECGACIYLRGHVGPNSLNINPALSELAKFRH